MDFAMKNIIELTEANFEAEVLRHRPGAGGFLRAAVRAVQDARADTRTIRRRFCRQGKVCQGEHR